MPIRRRDARDRLTFELVESSDEDVDDDAWPPVAAGPGRAPAPAPDGGRRPDPVTLRPGTLGPAALDPDDEESPQPLESPLDPPDTGEPVRRRGRRTAVVATVSVGVVLVLGGMLAVDAWHTRADLDRLRHATGGVEPIVDAPRELWSTGSGFRSGFSVLPGGFVTVEEGDAVVRDLRSGEVRWRTAVGEGAWCGAPGFWALPAGEPEDTLVCLAPQLVGAAGLLLPDTEITIDPLTGQRTDVTGWTVTALSEDGDVLGRRDVPADGDQVSVGPDATLLRVQRVGDPPEGDGTVVEQDPTTGEVVGLPTGRDVVVSAEDALTGEVRWRRELPFSASGAGACLTWHEGSEDPVASLEHVWAGTGQGLVQVEGCGVSAWFTPDGARLDVPTNPNDGIVRLPDGSFYRDPLSGGTGWGISADAGARFGPAVLDPDGTVRWKPPGPLHVPQATDGRSTDLLLGRDGIDLVAWDAAGTERWRTLEVGTPTSVAVVAGGVVVVPGPSSTLEGLDAATGRHLWTLTSDDLAPVGPGSAARSASWEQFFTDGERALVVLSDWSGGTTSLVAVDLAGGTVVWREEPTVDPGVSWLVALQGVLLRLDESSLSRVG